MDQNTTFVAISMKVFFVIVKVIVANAQIKRNNVGLNPKHYIMSDTNEKKKKHNRMFREESVISYGMIEGTRIFRI